MDEDSSVFIKEDGGLASIYHTACNRKENNYLLQNDSFPTFRDGWQSKTAQKGRECSEPYPQTIKGSQIAELPHQTACMG